MTAKPRRYGKLALRVPRIARRVFAPIETPTKRMTGRPWMRLRRLVMKEEPLCRHCTVLGKVRATYEVDHILPLVDGGTDDRSNLQGLCWSCHQTKTRNENDARRKT